MSETTKSVYGEQIEVELDGKNWTVRKIDDPIVILKYDRYLEQGRNPMIAILREYFENENPEFIVAFFKTENENELKAAIKDIFGVDLGKALPY